MQTGESQQHLVFSQVPRLEIDPEAETQETLLGSRVSWCILFGWHMGIKGYFRFVYKVVYITTDIFI